MKTEIQSSLEEIAAALEILINGSKEASMYARGWIKKHKQHLKDLGYSGKMPRKPRSDKKENHEQED